MADIKVNQQTGQIAIPQKDGGFKVYNAGQYKVNKQTGQYAVPQADGQWKIYRHERKGSILPLSTDVEGDLQFDLSAGIPGAIVSGLTAPGDIMSGKLNWNDPEFAQRAMDTSSLMLGVNPAARSGMRGFGPALVKDAPEVPSAQALRQAADAGYTQARGMGVDYSTAGVKSVADDILKELADEGFRDTFSPETFSILKELQTPPKDAVVDLVGLDTARKSFGHAAGSTERTEAKAATKAIKQLDRFLENPPAESVVAGDAATAGKTLSDARGNYAAAMRSDKIAGAAEQAELDAAVANSGTNIDNRTRQVLNSILKKQSARRGFSKDEIELIEQVARGKFGTNLARWAGNLLGGGGGFTATIPAAAGAFLGGMVAPELAAAGAALPIVAGRGLRALAGRMTKSQVRDLDEVIRMRSPLYQKALDDAPFRPQGVEMRALLPRGLVAIPNAPERRRGLRAR